MTKTEQIVLVIPCYNESLHIPNLLEEISLLGENNFSIVVIDDGSTDLTAKISSTYTDYVLCHSVNLGKGASLKTACDFAFNSLEANFVIMMDADEQHSPDDLHMFVDAINKHQELVLGVRSFHGMPKGPVLANKLTSFLIKIFYGTFIPDIPSGYKSISRNIYEQLRWKASGYEIEVEMAQKIAKQKLPFITVPIKTIYPSYIRGMNFLDGLKVLFRIMGFK